MARALTQWPESASGHRDRPSWPGFRLWLAGRRPDLVCWSDGTDAINASETDCLAVDAALIEPVSPCNFCEMQGDFRKMQGRARRHANEERPDLNSLDGFPLFR